MAGPTVADVKQTVTNIVRAELERDVDPSVDVFDQGATSLAFLRIVAQVNEKFDITADVADLEEASIDGLSELVAAQINTPKPITARD